jgi:hypothetical protein
MGNKDAKRREIRKPKKKPAPVAVNPPATRIYSEPPGGIKNS